MSSPLIAGLRAAEYFAKDHRTSLAAKPLTLSEYREITGIQHLCSSLPGETPGHVAKFKGDQSYPCWYTEDNFNKNFRYLEQQLS